LFLLAQNPQVYRNRARAALRGNQAKSIGRRILLAMKQLLRRIAVD